MNCPKCDGTLGKVTITKRPDYGDDVLRDAEAVERIEVDQCYSCNGIWLDAKELDQYLDEKLLILNSPQVKERKLHDQKTGRCPRCQKPMVKEKGPILLMTIDVCRNCGGIWLDSGEINRLQSKNLTWAEKNKLVFRNLKELFSRTKE